MRIRFLPSTCFFQTTFTATLASVFILALFPSARAETVALGSFEHIDFERNDPATSAGLVTAIQAGLDAKARWKFVERGEMERIFAEIGLSRRGLTSADTAARVGKLLKADLLLSGTFFGTKGSKAYVVLECDELSRAEPLGQARIELENVISKGHLILPSPEDLKKIVTEAARLLEASSAHVEAQRNRTTLKLLFLSNKSNNPSLAGIERLIAAKLEQSSSASTTHRTLRLDRPEIAAQESELALLGLVEADSAAWMQVADYYLWGSYEAIGADIKLTLTLWNGREQPREIIETGPADDLPAFSARLTTKILEAAIPAATNSTSDAGQDQRKKIAALLCAEAKKLAQGTSGAKGEAAEAVREKQRRLLAAAIFFAPTEPSGWTQLLSLRLSDQHTFALPALLRRVGDLEYGFEVAERFLVSAQGKIDSHSLYGLGTMSESSTDRTRELELDFDDFQEDLHDIYLGQNLLVLKERLASSHRVHLSRLAKKLETAAPGQDDDFREAAEFILTSVLEHPFTNQERQLAIDALWPRLKLGIFLKRAWTPGGSRMTQLDGLLRNFYTSQEKFSEADALNILSPAELAVALSMSAPPGASGAHSDVEATSIEESIASIKRNARFGKIDAGRQKMIDNLEKRLLVARGTSSVTRWRVTAFLESHAAPGTPVTVTESDLINGPASDSITMFHPPFDAYPEAAKLLQIPWLREIATKREAEGYPAAVVEPMRALADRIQKEAGVESQTVAASLSPEWSQRKYNLSDPKSAAVYLSEVSRNGDLPSLQALLDRGAPVAAAGSALVGAIQAEQWPAARFILEKGYDPAAPWPDLETRVEQLNWKDHPGRTALAEAAIRGNKELVEMLIKKGVRFDPTSDAGLYAVGRLTQSRRPELLQTIVKAGAKPDGHLDRTLEPLYYAIRNRDLRSLTILMEGGADPSILIGHSISMSSGLAVSSEWKKFDRNILGGSALGYCARQNWLEGAQVLLATRRVDFREKLHEEKPHRWATQRALRAAFLRAELEASSDHSANDRAGIDLFTAIAAGDQPAFTAALSRPGCLEYRGFWSQTAFMFACEEKATGMARQLLDAGASLDQFDTVGSSPLCYAARSGDIALVEAMVRKGAKLDEVQNNANRALDQALVDGRDETMALKLIQLGASYAPHPRKPATIPLFEATLSNLPKVVAELLRRGDDPHRLAGDFSIFFPAARSNNPELIQLFADLKCDLNQRKDNWTPLITAVRWGAPNSVRKLLELGLRDPNAAVMAVSMVKDLQPPNRPDPSELGALHYDPDYRACLEVMEELGQLEGSKEARASIFWRASHSIPEIEAYLSSGGDVNFSDVLTPLQRAVSTQNIELVNYLLSKGANPNLIGTSTGGYDRSSPLQFAVNGTPAMVELLLKHGANPNELTRGDYPSSIFALACGNNSVPLETLRLFIRYGADPNIDARQNMAKFGERTGPRNIQVLFDIFDGK